MGDALLALCERGGFSSVDNPGGWLRVVARREEVHAVRALARERRAWKELAGLGTGISRKPVLHGTSYVQRIRELERAAARKRRARKKALRVVRD